MAIGAIELNGAIQRTQDYSPIKQNEDNKAMFNQLASQNEFEKTVGNSLTRVNQGAETRKEDKGFDPRTKGSNEYAGDGGRYRKKPAAFEGVVPVKGYSSFDLKV